MVRRCGFRENDLCYIEGMVFLSSFSVEIMNVGAFNISHLLFAEGTLIFCGANPNHFHNLHCLFLCFEVVSGLRINRQNQSWCPIGNVNYVEGVAFWVAGLFFAYEISSSSIGSFV
jgi:hypothetical protein